MGVESLFPKLPDPPEPSGGRGDAGGHKGEAHPDDILYTDPHIYTTGGNNGNDKSIDTKDIGEVRGK